MPVPPAAAVTMQAVEELVKQCVQREVFRLQKSLDELAKDLEWALEVNLSLRRAVGEMGWQLIKLCEDNHSFQQTPQMMAERVNARDDGGDQNREQRHLTPLQK